MIIQQHSRNAAAIRRMTICNKAFARNGGQYVFFPMILLSGKWLREVGFKSGQVIEVTCEDRKLVITLSSEQRFDRV